MNRSFYLMVFAICLAANCGLISGAPAEALSAVPKNILGRYLHSSSRVVRQAPPDFTPPTPPPPEMFTDKFSRKKREAKGGGSMPTRKG